MSTFASILEKTLSGKSARQAIDEAIREMPVARAVAIFRRYGIPVEGPDFKKKYRAVARKLHPDVGGNTEKMAELSAAYDSITAPSRASKPLSRGRSRTRNYGAGHEGLIAKLEAVAKSRQFSPKMTAIIAYFVDQSWTNPTIGGISITSDGFVMVNGGLLDSADDMERNIELFLDEAGLTASERSEWDRKYAEKLRGNDWRR